MGPAFLPFRAGSFHGLRRGTLFDVEWSMSLAEDDDALAEGEDLHGSSYVEYDRG